jgi:hypothetical protein
MEQINIPAKMKVEIDYERPGIPSTAKLLQPILFKEGHTYCCVLGPGIQEGIVGFGETPEQAIQDWDINLSQRMKHAGVNDYVTAEAKHILHQQATGNTGADRPVSPRQPAQPGEGGANDTTSRKITADQTKTDGSEFR